MTHRPQIPYALTFKCGHTAERKTRIDTPSYIARKQRVASGRLCPACENEAKRAAEEKREAAILNQIPEGATELERIVAIASASERYPGFVVSEAPIASLFIDVDEGTEIVYVKRKSAEETLRRLRLQNPGKHITLIGFSDRETPEEYQVFGTFD